MSSFNPLMMTGGGIPRMLYSSNATSSANQSSYTFAAKALGNPKVGRIVALAIEAGRDAAASFSITSGTIGGISVASAVSAHVIFQDSIQRGVLSQIVYALVPSGSTGDIVLNFSTTISNIAVQVMSLYNMQSSTPYHTASVTQGNSGYSQVALNIPKYGAALSAWNGCDWSFSSGSGVTWDSGFYIEYPKAFGYAERMTEEAGRIIGVSVASATSTSLVAASWR